MGKSERFHREEISRGDRYGRDGGDRSDRYEREAPVKERYYREEPGKRYYREERAEIPSGSVLAREEERRTFVAPQKVVNVDDLPNMRAGDDLYMYFTKFEGSYLGAIDHVPQRIFAFTNKLVDVDIIYSSARTLNRYTNWARFKGKMLR